MDANTDISGMMHATGLVPVFHHDDDELALEVLHASYEGGLRIFEFTRRGKHAETTFSKLKAFADKSLPDMMLGAGSIVTGNSAEEFIGMGAGFIVSPLFSESVNDICQSHDVMHIPGCGTVTEIGNAHKAGAGIVKLFPAEVYGPTFIRAILGPMPWSRIMPTGGVTTERTNLKAWFDAGAWCVGMGSALFAPGLLTKGKMDDLRDKISETIRVIREVRDA